MSASEYVPGTPNKESQKMGHTRTLVLFAGAALGLGATVASAQNSLDQSRAYQSELSADAAGRTSLLSAAQPTGHDDKGFFMSDGTGNYRLNVGGYEQFRYVANWRSSSGASPDHSFTGGFQSARTRLIFNGNIVNPDLTFRIEADVSRATGTFGLMDSYGQYKLSNGWSVKWGQYKLPLLREELVPDTCQLTVERSITNAVFTQTRSQGIEANYETDSWRVYLDVSDGLRTLNTDLGVAAQADWAFTGRAEWKWAGDWKQFRQFTSWQNADTAAMLGLAGHYQHGGGTGVTTPVNVAEYTMDASVLGNGWNVFGAGIGRHTKPSGGGGSSTDDFGVVAQGGVFVSSKDELFGRYDGVLPDSSRAPLDKIFHTVTAGWNHYFAENSQAAKFTADVEWNLTRTTENALITTPNSAAGLLTDSKSNQVALRLQFQLVF
jgi:hypothetical protein